MDCEDVPTLGKRQEAVEEIFELYDQVLPSSRLPTDFLNGLAEKDSDKATCLLAIPICWYVTGGLSNVPAMQLSAILADRLCKYRLGLGAGRL